MTLPGETQPPLPETVRPPVIDYAEQIPPLLLNDTGQLKRIVLHLKNKTPEELSDVLLSNYHLDPSLAETYFSDHVAEFRTGLPANDNVNRQHLLAGRRMTVGTIVDNYSALLHGHYHNEETLLGGAQNPYARQKAATMEGSNMETYVSKHPQGKQWLAGEAQMLDAGPRRNPVVAVMANVMSLDYYEEMGAQGGTLGEGITLNDIRLVYGDEPAPANPTLGELASKRRERGLVDTSKELLDARVEMLLTAINMGYTQLCLSDLRQMGQFGGERKLQAQALFDHYKDVLFDKDLMPKIELMHQISAGYRKLAVNARGARQKKSAEVLTMLADRAARTNWHTADWTRGLELIYEQLGYEEPTQLLEANDLWDRLEEDRIAAEEAAAAEAIAKVAKKKPVAVKQRRTTELASETPSEVSPERIALDGTAEAIAKEKLSRLIVRQLDEVILPYEHMAEPREFKEKLMEAIKRTSRGGEFADGGDQWAKIDDLASLCIEFGGRMYRSKTAKFKDAPPYFVAVFEHEGRRIAVAESEKYGNSTYVVDEAITGESWLETLTLKRWQAKEKGAVAIRHTKNAPHGPMHVAKVRESFVQAA